jgi:hypothetical protein
MEYQCLKHLTNAVDEIVSCASAYDGLGPFRVLIPDLLAEHELNETHIPLLVQMLGERTDVYDFEEIDDEFILCREPMPPVHQEELEIAGAKHLLWCYGQPGGEKADFSGRTLHGLDLFHMRFSRAIFADAVITDSCMDEGNFFNCDFSGAELRNNSVYNAEFVGARFNGATIADCGFKDGFCMSACFSGAQFTGCDFTNVALDDTDFTQADIRDCEGLDDISQGPAMTMGG